MHRMLRRHMPFLVLMNFKLKHETLLPLLLPIQIRTIQMENHGKEKSTLYYMFKFELIACSSSFA